MNNFEAFVESYVGTGLELITDTEWEGREERSDDDIKYYYTREDIPSETMEKIVSDCEKFWDRCGDKIEALTEAVGTTDVYDTDRDLDADRVNSRCAGCDFYLTRFGTGSGYADGHWEQLEDFLYNTAKSFKENDWYIGDDNKIYIM